MVLPALIGLALLAVGVRAIGGDGAVPEVAYLVGLVAASGLAWIGCTRCPTERRRAWAMVALGVTLATLADVTYHGLLWVQGETPDVSGADALWLASYVALAAGLLGLSPGRSAGQPVDADALIDSLVVGVAALLVLWELTLADLLGTSSAPLLARIIWSAYPVLDVVLLCLVVRLLILDPRTRSLSQWLLSAGAFCWLGGDLGFVLDTTGAADTWLHVGWMAGPILLGSASIAPGSAGAPDAAPVRVGLGRMWLVMAPLLLPAGLELRGYLSGEDTNPVMLIAGSIALIGLGSVRCQRLLRAAETARAAVQRNEEHFRALSAHSADAVVVLDGAGCVREVVGDLRPLVGLDGPALMGANLDDIPTPVDESTVDTVLRRALDNPGVVLAEEIEVRLDGEEPTWLGVRIVNLLDDPAVDGLVFHLHDVTARKRAEGQLAHQAFHDALTGLANRALFADRIGQALHRAARHEADPAVLFLDVDGFKAVNDRLGHEAGDVLLCRIADRLRGAVRAGDTVARLGGDEFAILIEENHQRADEAVTTAERILQVMAEPLEVDGQVLTVTASLGLAVSDADSTPASLLRDADIAMYRAKAAGKAMVVRYDAQMGAEVGDALQLELDLAGALAAGQFELHYQPVVDLSDERITGFEALLRWRHPRLGLVAPDLFIPLAERTGLIVPIGRWVLATACAAAVEWPRAEGDGGPPLTVAVNLSARQLASGDVVADVRDALVSSGLPASSLVLEMTETALVADPTEAAGRLVALSGLGVRLAVDDFGTGYSSLNYLRQFPFDILKIDRCFIETITDGAVTPPIVRGLLDLAHTLDLEIVAEGIEQPAQLDGLRRERCALGQGYLFSKPIPAAEVAGLLGRLAPAAPLV